MRPEKNLLKEEVKGQIDDFDSFVVVQYAGLQANAANEFRRAIRGAGGEVQVVRKRILVKAAAEAGIGMDLSSLTGHVGVVFLRGADPVDAMKYIVQFGNEKEKAVRMIGGHFEGKLYSGSQVEYLASLPGKNEMRAQFLSLLEAPLSQTLAVFEALLTSVPHCLNNKSKQAEEGA